MKKRVILLLVIFALSLSLTVKADEYEDLGKQIEQISSVLDASKKATATNEKNLEALNIQLTDIKNKVATIERNLARKEREVQAGEERLTQQRDALNNRVVSYYKNLTRNSDSFLQVFMSENLSVSLKEFFYQKALLDEDRKAIMEIVLYVKELEDKKIELQREKARLIPIKQQIDSQSQFLAAEVDKAKKSEAEMQNRIAQLSARQQAILAAKLSSLNLPTSMGAGPIYCTDDRKLDPGFGNAFAFFTFGIPHRVGLNQYGAYGRAKAGQNYQDILRAYFNNISIDKRDPNMKIKVQGFGEMTLDQYMLGIYEVPNSWPLEALKAQAVAARSYAVSYTNNGANEICTTQSCQVYKGGNKGGAWEQAVKDTAGEVLVSDGAVVKAWFASTFGGYAFTSGDVWGSNKNFTKRLRDTTGDINSFNDLFDKAYDKESPCFYAAQGYRSEYNKSAWLKSEEVADIVNVLLLAKRDSGTQNHLSQPDKSNPDGTDTWDRERVKSELRSRGGNPLSSVNSVNIDWDKGSGMTTNITISGDGGSYSFNGNEFKTFFNLRAPANIQIVGPLFNVERK